MPSPISIRIGVWGSALALLSGSACAGDPDSDVARAECLAVDPAAGPPEVARVLDLGRLVDVRRHRLQKDVLTASGLSTQSVSELAEEIPRSLEGTTWTVIQVDDEGFESEVYLSGKRGELGIVKMRETACPDQTSVTITIDLS